MAVLLVIEAHSKAPIYAPLISALERHGAKRLHRTVWLLESGTIEDLKPTLNLHLPIDDGYSLAEISRIETRKAQPL